MSSPFEEAPARHEGGGKKGGILGAKVGGVPAWGIGVGLALLVLAVMWYRNKQSAATAAASTAAADSTDTTSATDGSVAGLAYDDPNQIDPNTGVTFASEGYTTTAEVDSYLDSGAVPTTESVGLTPQGLSAPTTNTQWAQLVADYLIGKGDDPTLVSNAISAYTNGQTLTTAEQAVINMALDVFGEPPEGVIPVSTTAPGGGSDTGTTTTGTGSTSATGTVTVPKVTGLRGEDGKKAVEKAGLVWKQDPDTTPAGKTTTVKTQDPKAGSKVDKGSTVSVTLSVEGGRPLPTGKS